MSNRPGLNRVRVRAVLVDADGTLLDSSGHLDAETVQAVRLATLAGIQICIASSRSPASVHRLMIELGIGGPCVAHQGAWIGNLGRLGTPEVSMLEHRLQADAARSLLEEALQQGLATSWYSGSAWYATGGGIALTREAEITGDVPTIVQSFESTKGRPLHRILVRASARLLDRLPRLEEYARGLGLTAALSHERNLEVTGPGADKGAGLRRVARALGIEPTALAAIGDGDNDLPMFEEAGLSIAMGNASVAVKGHADWVTATNAQQGVAMVLRSLAADLGVAGGADS